MPTIETSILPGTYNIEASMYAPLVEEVYLEDVADDGTATPVDVTDGTWTAQVRILPGNTTAEPLATLGVAQDDDSTPGVLVLTLDADTMRTLSLGHSKRKLHWDLRQASTGEYWLAGEFLVDPRVTQ